jgi:hypothetical protein
VSDKPSIRLKFRETSPASARSSSVDPGSKARSPILQTEALVVRCGHAIVFDLYAKDPFRAERRAKATARDCPPCRQARVAAEVEAAAARKAQRKIEQKGQLAAILRAYKPRLPDGACFAATYDAAMIRWTGVVTIEGATFKESAGSLSRLLHKLDDAYRASLGPPAVDESTE